LSTKTISWWSSPRLPGPNHYPRRLEGASPGTAIKGLIPMTISLVHNPDVSRFELYVDGQLAGSLTYERSADTLSFLDIATDQHRAGQGLGVVLVRQALDAASAQGLPVLPVCPFVRDFILRHPVYLDVVPAEHRQRFQLPLAPGL
jgi:predicted GNAT family acetyltransferase